MQPMKSMPEPKSDPMSISGISATGTMGRRRPFSVDISNFESAVAALNVEWQSRRLLNALDICEQLLGAFPENSQGILTTVYDMLAALPNSRSRFLYQSRAFDFGIRPDWKVLDIGSGNDPFPLATHLADLTVSDNQVGRAGVPFKELQGKPVYECNIERMPFADKEFDFVFCSHVLEHVGDPEKACSELMRVGRCGYIETPSPAKDLWLDTIAVSNHRWAVESVGEKLVFTEYSPAQKIGLQNNILRDMACSPQTPREKAFSALIYLKANLLNTMLLWNGRFAYEVRRWDWGTAGAHVALPSSYVPVPSQQKQPGVASAFPVVPKPLERDEVAPLDSCSQDGRPRFSFVMIVLNGMPLIEYSLRSIYDFAHEIIVVEGAVKNCMAAAKPDGSSRDGTVEFLRSFPDPKRKIRLFQGLWPEKCQMQNKALEHVTGDYVWLIDSDEVYKPQDLKTLRDLLVKDPAITQINFIPDNFWKGLDYIFVSPMFLQSDHHYRRLFKYVPGAVFTTHRPPTMVWPGSNQTTEQMRLLDGFQTRKMGILIYHYSYVFEHQVAQKNSYYARQWGDRVNGVDRQEWFDRCYRAWTPQNRQQIETQYPVWINDRNSRTEPFSGTHPAVMEEFRLRLQHAQSSAPQGGVLFPPVKASAQSSPDGPALGSKGKVACDYVSSGATVNTESQFAVGIRDLFARIRPRKIIETGTYLGTGTTTIIARALEELGISDAVFYTIEINPKHWSQAKDYFRDARLNVHAILGLSIPRSMLPSPAQIEKQTVADLGGEDIFVDHRPGERVGAYHRETDFPDVPDNRLYECLKTFRFCPDFVLLDSAGHIGAIEFDYLLEHLRGPCHIALDDIYHIKHHRNFQRMKSDPRFEILTASKEKFGFCIARFTPQPASRSETIRRILWLRTDSIGDGILSASMLPHIHRRFGDARITVVCQRHIAELYESCPHVEDVITVPSEHRWESDAQYREFLGKVRACNPDLLLNSTWATHGLADLPGLEFIPRRMALRQVRNAVYTQIIPTDPAPMPELHRHRDFLRGLGIEVDSLRPHVWLTEEDTRFAEQLFRQHGLNPERTIALFAGTRTPHRQYEQYGQAIRAICAENRLSIVALGCKSDLGVNQRNLLASGVGGLNLSGGCTLRQTAALLQRCRLAIGAETGLAHLACAVGTPNVILLGGGHFGRFMPYSPLTTIAALPLDCYGCDWTCRHKRIHCVRDLNPGVLAHAVREALSCDSKDIRVCLQGPSLWTQHPDRPQWQGCQSWLPSQPTRIITLNDSATPETQRRVASEVPADR